MKDGFLKIACGIPDIKVADCEYNAKNITDLIFKAENEACIFFAVDDIPAFGFALTLACKSTVFFCRVHLHGKVIHSINEFYENGEVVKILCVFAAESRIFFYNFF
mgnify:CR=1 FL=1